VEEARIENEGDGVRGVAAERADLNRRSPIAVRQLRNINLQIFETAIIAIENRRNLQIDIA
jgi:hypothetical protein